MNWHPSPNCGERRAGARPDIVVIHYTAMASAEKARDWLCNPEAEVSAHYLIGKDGAVWHMVAEEMRAWHAGAGAWGAVTDVNSRSIGIELDNGGAEPFSEPLMAALEALLAGIMQRWSIVPERVIAHSDLAPGRKIDPGPRFDWDRLARQGLAVSAAAGASSGPDGPSSAAAFAQNAAQLGYTADAPEEAILAAFRLRHRPGAEGPLDNVDTALVMDLARRFPVDARGLSA
ncbi:N-acetylmuramoyl-L-alanine amidase [Candidatus Rhodobacter oscarellae]|uniref:N-acetylmuramoyl-L-alanine amidase n=1 Tax=Candidatus Rhodobacter oscarellae TaxID=1675527 RepID=A0A0J9E6Z8_9RHOB|nr:N-acetylmuramoyl-L-alanine amidase [Candidatus Rhodobacter lobularis]KMW58456.1 N-acetylmuramoyl-L-alanine amidase [Candidatus Rhodobacter lobularis]